MLAADWLLAVALIAAPSARTLYRRGHPTWVEGMVAGIGICLSILLVEGAVRS